MRRFLFLALYVTVAFGQTLTWSPGADNLVNNVNNWVGFPSGTLPTTATIVVIPTVPVTMEFPASYLAKWGSLDYSTGNVTFKLNPNSELGFAGNQPTSLFSGNWNIDGDGPATVDLLKIRSSDSYNAVNFRQAYARSGNLTLTFLGIFAVDSYLRFGTGSAPTFNYYADFRTATPANVSVPFELPWRIGILEVASPSSGDSSLHIYSLPLGARRYAKACTSSCTLYEECCIVNITLTTEATINGPFDMLYDTSAMRMNFVVASTATVVLNENLTFESAEVTLGGTWQIGTSASVLATALHIAPLGASATRAEISGTISGGTVSLIGYNTLTVQSTVDLSSTKVVFQGEQIDFYGTELSGATLETNAPTFIAHLDETNVRIGTLNILTSTTLTQGFIWADTLSGQSTTFYVNSGASLTVGAFTNPPDIVLESFSSILAISSLPFDENILQGAKSLLLVQNSFVGENVPGTFPLRVGEGATLTYAAGTTSLTRQLELFGGTAQFNAAEVTIGQLIARFRSNATIKGNVINVNELDISATKVVNKVLVIDTNTRLNVLGSLNVTVPTGSVAVLSGAGTLDVSQGSLEVWSGKLIIQTDFIGSVTLRGGSVEFQKLTDSTSHNITSVIMVGGNVESTLSEYSLPVLQWSSGSIRATRTLTIGRLEISGTGAKALVAGSTLNISSIEIAASVSFDASSNTIINNVGEFFLPSDVSLNGGQVTFNNYGLVTVSSGASFTCGNFLNAAASQSIARRSVAQTTSSGAITIMEGGSIQGSFVNAALLQATGTINGNLVNRGQIYVGNFTQDNVGMTRQLTITGTFDNVATSTITPQVFLKIGGSAAADTDLIQAATMNLGGVLTLNFTFSTKSVDALTSWLVISAASYTNQFATVAADTFEGVGRLVYTTTGAQWEFVGCHNEKNNCTVCIKQTGTSFPNGCDWCLRTSTCRSAGTCGSDALSVVTVGEENQCPDAPVNTLLYLIFIPGGLVLGGGVVVLIFLLKRRNRVGGSQDAVLLKKKPGPPEFLPIAFGPSMIESKLSKKDRDLVPALERLKDLLLEENMEVVTAITDNDVIKAVDLDKVCQSLTYVFESVGRYPHLLNALVDREVELHHSDEASLLRGNTVATISWKFYSKLVGLEYLWNTLSDDIYLLVEKTSSGEISTEMDPVLLGEEEDVKVNKYQLMLTAQQILSKIIKSVEHVPLPMKFICHHLQERVMAKYPSMRYTSVGGFIFLRFLNPAINLPEAYGLTRKVPSKEARRVFVLLTKTLQSLANAIKLGGKEQHMAKLNDFIDENQNEINQFFDQCAILPEGSAEEYLKPIEIPHYILLVCMAEIHRHIHYSIQRIKEKLSKEKFEQLSGILAEIGGPIKIDNSTSKNDSKVDSLLAGIK